MKKPAKEPPRNFKCPDCAKPMVNAHAVRVHRMWKHPGTTKPDAPTTPAPTPKPAPVEPKPETKPRDDWW